MRDNGLTAATYVSMGGIDPLVAEPVLAALAEAGIAAYAAAPGEEKPVTETAAGDAPVSEAPVREAPVSEAPATIRPGLEEIFVDAGSVERARAVIRRSTEDAEWQSLIEQFNAPPAPGHTDSPVPRWPASEDVDEAGYEPLIDVPSGLDREPDGDPDAEEGAAAERRAARRQDPHDHFVPPEPPRGPRLDWISRAAWLGLIGGPVLLILAAMLDFGASRITLLAVVGFIGGFITLVVRMKDQLPPDETGDDGAVV